MDTQRIQHKSLDQLTARVISRVQRLIDQVANSTASEDDMLGTQLLLDASPMTTEEFGLATNRVRNAYR